MAAQECELFGAGCCAYRLHHRVVQRRNGRKRPRRAGALRDPGTMLEDVADGGDEAGRIACIQLVERNRHGRIFTSR